MKKLIIILVTGYLVLGGSVTTIAGNRPDPAMGFQKITLANGISYARAKTADMSNSSSALMNLDNDAYNLKILYNFQDEEAISLVNIKIRNAKGKVLLDTTINGSWFFVKVPPGLYQVTTYYDRQYETRNIIVGKPPETVVEDWTF